MDSIDSAMFAAFENWWDKYAVSLNQIETEGQAEAEKLTEFMRGLGYD